MESNLQEHVVETREIGIAGMTCDHWVKRVERALLGAGAESVSVHLNTGRAKVRFDRRKTDMPRLHEALHRSGYRAAASAT